MPTVVFRWQSGGGGLSISANAGDALVDLCDQNRTDIPFSCRSASCGTCRIIVLAGAEGLDEPGDEELDVLDAFGVKPPSFRLACQAKLSPLAAAVEVRPVRDDE